MLCNTRKNNLTFCLITLKILRLCLNEVFTSTFHQIWPVPNIQSTKFKADTHVFVTDTVMTSFKFTVRF